MRQLTIIGLLLAVAGVVLLVWSGGMPTAWWQWAGAVVMVACLGWLFVQGIRSAP